MNLKLTLAALLIAPLALTACSKKEEAPAAGQAQTAQAEEKVTPEQQAAIDAIDQPVMDEKNTDVSAEEAKAAEEAAAAEAAGSEAQ